MFLRTTVGAEPGVEIDLTATGVDPGVDLQLGRGSRGEEHVVLTAEEARRVAIALREVADAAEERRECRPVLPVHHGTREYVKVDLSSHAFEDGEWDEDWEEAVHLVFHGMFAGLDVDEARQVASVLVQAAEAIGG